MKKVKLLVAGLTLLFASVSWASTDDRISASSGANMRMQPGVDHQIISTVPHGASVRVIERTNDHWVKVEYKGKTGYIASELLSQDTKRHNSSTKSNASSSKPQPGKPAKKKSSKGGNSYNQRSGAQAKNWGLGLRLGDPTGLTVKKYQGDAAWELNIGSSPNFGYYDYEKRFYYYDWSRGYKLLKYDRTFATSVQLHFLKHLPIADGGNLELYYGGGGQARFTQIQYWYEHNGHWDIDRRTYVDLGLDGKVGLEYSFKEVPFSIFVDATLYLELYYKPMWLTGMGGLGIRYNF